MKIVSDNAALALTQTNANAAAAAKRREAAELDVASKAKANAEARVIVDTVELTEPKPEPAQTSRSAAQNTPAPAPAAPTPEPADPLAEILKAFGQRSGDSGFNSALDTNGDGVINFADLNAALSAQKSSGAPQTGGPLPVEPNPAAADPASVTADDADDVLEADDAQQNAPAAPVAGSDDEGPAVFTAADLDNALSAFGAAAGDEAFNAAYDFDNDGVINFGDLNELLSRIGGQGDAQQSLLDQLTERFGASSGDERFNVNLDFDNDGVINFGDLNTLLSNLAQNIGGE